MSPDLLLTLTMACAPLVHPETALRLIKHESAGNPFAIGINGPYRLSPQPKSHAQAVATAKMLLNAGLSIDMGLGMINNKNLSRLGLSVEGVFDPCTNLRAMQTVLGTAYDRAAKRMGLGQAALQAALSEYNTGNAVNGLKNGYVSAIYRMPAPQTTRTHASGFAPSSASAAQAAPAGQVAHE